MGCSQELSEFQRGTVIGCHLCNKSSRDISSLLNIPHSTVSCILRKWKCVGVTATQPPSGRPRKLMERGHSQNLVATEMYLKQNINFCETGSCGHLDITIRPKQNMGKIVEGLMVTIHMSKVVLSANLTATQGNCTYDLTTKLLVWDIEKLNPQELPNLRDKNPSLNIDLKIQQLTISGLKVSPLYMYGEKYKQFKGVKYLTKAGELQVQAKVMTNAESSRQ
uniref:MHD domain-containing protein n=1 Tax=Amphiprion percula TaxID=161767 RepID=A0A3P8S250_AMPPE